MDLLNRIHSWQHGLHGTSTSMSTVKAESHTNSAQKQEPSMKTVESKDMVHSNTTGRTTNTVTESMVKNDLLRGETPSREEIYRRYGVQLVDYTFPCIYPECSAQFNRTEDLYRHIRSHSPDNNGSNTTRCPYCSKRSNMPCVVSHVRTHTGYKPFICPFPKCGQKYTQKHNLKTHLLSEIHQLSNYIFI